MKGSFLWKLMYVFCALAGILAGYGVVSLVHAEDINPNTNTKDNTLVREAGDSVFFDEETEEPQEKTQVAEPAKLPPSLEPTPTEAVQERTAPSPFVPAEVKSPQPTVLPEPTILPEPTVIPEPDVGHAAVTPQPDSMPSLSSQWVENGSRELPLPNPGVTQTEQSSAAETITYPAEIFGQVPVINRSDTYVSYFEFAYDLISMLEPQVKARGLNLNSLLAKFVVKALFCGVDIEKLDINAPIPRRLAALCLWLAAQVLNEEGSNTSAKAVLNYVTDIGSCSIAERKAVAYLYEQGILKGYQTPGQKFYPDAGLKTESGSTWLSGVQQCWK